MIFGIDFLDQSVKLGKSDGVSRASGGPGTS